MSYGVVGYSPGSNNVVGSHPTAAQQELLVRLSRLRTRLDEGLLRVAVLGQFKRGKSTLLNALLGVPLLPTGVTPVTAIPTFIKAGPKTTAVNGANSRASDVGFMRGLAG
jgi:ribosome biogenesis GTPase A